MGITIGDTITLACGLTNSNSYGSFGKSEIRIEKQDSNYLVSCRGLIWATESLRSQSKAHIGTQAVSITINSSQLTSNLYSLLYTEWKTNYSSVSDVL